MCNYTQVLHTLCGCKTFDLPTPNLCRLAIKNCTPCLYIAPRPDSLNSEPSMSYSMSTISNFSFPHSPRTSSFYSFQASPQFHAFINAQEKEDSVKRQMMLCPFHLEDMLEDDLELSGQEKFGLGRRAFAKAKHQKKMKKGKNTFAWYPNANKRKRVAGSSPEKESKKVGNWDRREVGEQLANGTGNLVTIDRHVYLVTDKTTLYLGVGPAPSEPVAKN